MPYMATDFFATL